MVELLAAGDLFGLGCEAVLDCTAETLTPTRIRAFDRRSTDHCAEFQRLVAAHSQVQIHKMRDHALLLGRMSARERLASLLVWMAVGHVSDPDFEIEPGKSAFIALPMTRQEIADYLGLTIETVSRTFSAMKRQGLLSFERQDRVRLPDLAAVCDISGLH